MRFLETIVDKLMVVLLVLAFLAMLWVKSNPGDVTLMTLGHDAILLLLGALIRDMIGKSPKPPDSLTQTTDTTTTTQSTSGVQKDSETKDEAGR